MKFSIHVQHLAILACVWGCVGCKSPFSKSTGASFGGGAAANASAYPGLAGGSTKPGNSLSKAWKSSTGAVAAAFTPKPARSSGLAKDDPTNLETKGPKISADVFIAAAQVYESQGKAAEAIQQYQKALDSSPRELSALVGMARLQDGQGNTAKALALYQQAQKASPKNALVYNDLGLCHARQHDLPVATKAFQQAVELAPAKANYRNNLAMVLVEAGKPDEALQQLKAVNSVGVAQYNLACLLSQRDQNDLAIGHLQQALASEPSLVAAEKLLAALEGNSAIATTSAAIPTVNTSALVATAPARYSLPRVATQVPAKVVSSGEQTFQPPATTETPPASSPGPYSLQPDETDATQSTPGTYRISDGAESSVSPAEGKILRR